MYEIYVWISIQWQGTIKANVDIDGNVIKDKDF